MCFKIFISIAVITCCLVSCKSESKKNRQDFKLIIDTLSTQESKEQFLLNVFQRDQQVRNPNIEKEILEKTQNNMESPEYRNYIKQMNQVDSLNFHVVTYYLKKHGYPDFEFDNALAEYAIMAVARHQPPGNRMELLPYLQKAYENGSLKAEYFSTFLEEIHINRFGESLRINTTTTYEKIIEVLIEKLNIQ